MKRRKYFFVFSFLASVLMFAAACSSGSQYVLPTLAPTYTPTPKPEENNGPTPTPAPDADNTMIITLNGEDFNQTSHFSARGVGSISVKPTAHSGSYAFYVMGRDAAWHGMSLNFSDTNGKVYNVIGKMIHVAAYVYQETGEPQDFSFTLAVKKPDGTPDTPESVSVSNVPSGKWTLLEGDIPVYANVTSPTVSIEMSSSVEPFYFDDIRVTYDESSAVAANKEYNAASFDVLYFDFEDGETHLDSRGSGAPSLASGEGPDGSTALYVSGRSQSWNGVQIDLTEYALGGTKLWISYDAKHAGSQKTKVTCSLQYTTTGSKNEKYANITSTESVLPGEWTEGSATTTITSMADSVILYFETAGTEDFYVDNVMISTKDPSTITIDKDSKGETVIATKIDTTGYVTIHSLNADNRSTETQIMSLRGSAKVEVVSSGHSENGFRVYGRTANWNGFGLDFKNLDNESFDVIGKNVYVSAWVYQNTGAPLDFSATLQVNKPDGTATWPERAELTVLPSGQWTHVEGILPVYANVKVPQINFEVPGSADAEFIIDDILVMYDPNSSVDPNPDYEEAAKKTFTGVNLNFEDNNAFFEARGNGKPSIVYGGHESDLCLAVTGRSSSWHGVQADLSAYDLAGKTLEVSYWVCHDSTTPFAINMTAEQNDGSNTTYTPVVTGDEIADGKWVKYTNTYEVPSNVKKFILYFESPVADASFYVDDVSIQLK